MACAHRPYLTPPSYTHPQYVQKIYKWQLSLTKCCEVKRVQNIGESVAKGNSVNAAVLHCECQTHCCNLNPRCFKTVTQEAVRSTVSSMVGKSRGASGLALLTALALNGATLVTIVMRISICSHWLPGRFEWSLFPALAGLSLAVRNDLTMHAGIRQESMSKTLKWSCCCSRLQRSCNRPRFKFSTSN